MKHVPAYRAFRRAQSGASLIVLAVILVLGTTGVLLGALNAATNNTTAAKHAKSGRALAEAKLALLGYAATQASTDNYPGRLPCPEADGYYGDPAQEGIASPYCTLLTPAVGRLPWRTLGLSKLTDGYGEPLWYVVSPGFALPSSTASVSINSNTAAQLTVDGTSAAAVALIIAPGAPMNVQSAMDCIPRVQSRSASPPDLRDYLECENASTELTTPYKFATTGPSTSFNDQVVKITHAELFSVIEPVVAKRIETQIAPVLKTVYAGSDWSTSTTNPVFPSAVPFTDPNTSTFLGSSSTTTGLLPMFTSATDPSRIVWYRTSETFPPSVSKLSGAGTLDSYDCSATSTTGVNCVVTFSGDVRIQVQAAARRVGRTMRQLNAAAVPLSPTPGSWAHPTDPSLSVSASFIPTSTSGAAYVYVQAKLPSGGSTATVTVPIEVLADHSLTDPNNPNTGWFVKNNWHHLVYYAFAPNFVANGAHSCNSPPVTPVNCLTVNNLTPTGKQRAILIFAGRALGTQVRPSGTLSDYLENPLNLDINYSEFAKQAISKTQNDRVVVVDANP